MSNRGPPNWCKTLNHNRFFKKTQDRVKKLQFFLLCEAAGAAKLSAIEMGHCHWIFYHRGRDLESARTYRRSKHRRDGDVEVEKSVFRESKSFVKFYL